MLADDADADADAESEAETLTKVDADAANADADAADADAVAEAEVDVGAETYRSEKFRLAELKTVHNVGQICAGIFTKVFHSFIHFALT